MRYNYDLFCQRKRFLIKNYFTIYPNASYEDFCLFLTQRSVIPPSKEYFEVQKEKRLPKEEPQSADVKEDLDEPAKEVKKSRRRRTTKTNQEKSEPLDPEVKKPRRRRRSAKKNDS